MKTIGLIGGMSPESSLVYYQKLVKKIQQEKGHYHSGTIILYSINFLEIKQHLEQQNWQAIERLVAQASTALMRAGAELLAICSNTIHKVLPDLRCRYQYPFISILDPVSHYIKQNKLKTVALLGTEFTMREKFFSDRWRQETRLERIITPNSIERAILHRHIVENFSVGQFSGASNLLHTLCSSLSAQGAEAIILGCTELPLILTNEETPLGATLIDTLALHVDLIVQRANNNLNITTPELL